MTEALSGEYWLFCQLEADTELHQGRKYGGSGDGEGAHNVPAPCLVWVTAECEAVLALPQLLAVSQHAISREIPMYF